MHLAVQFAEIDVVNLLLKNGANPNTHSRTGKSALAVAAQFAGIDTIKLLIENKAKINDDKVKGMTPLMSAAFANRADIVLLLISLGVDVNARTADTGETALMFSSKSLDTSRILLEHHADVNLVANNGATALIRASEANNIEVVKSLVEAGADVNRSYNTHSHSWGMTPLLFAAEYASTEMFEFLLSKGADISARGAGIRAVDWSSNGNALERAIRRDDAKFVDYLLAQGHFSLSTSEKDEPLAILAAKNNALKVIKLLVAKGADTSKEWCNNTALSWAASKSSAQMVEYLLEQGFSAQGDEGEDALMNALLTGKIATLEVLIKHGASLVQYLSSQNTTPIEFVLHYSGASYSNLEYNEKLEFIKFLTVQYRDVNMSVNKDEMTLLMVISRSRLSEYICIDILEYLLNRGAKVDKCDKQGKNAIDHAREAGNEAVANYLK